MLAKSLAAIVSLLLITQAALSQESKVIETCSLSSIELSQDTQIKCDGDLTLKSETTINTNGHTLNIYAKSANLRPSLNISSAKAASNITIYVQLTLDGDLNITNTGEGFGDWVRIEAGSLHPNYTQSINNGISGGEVEMLVGGESVQLQGENNSIARK